MSLPSAPAIKQNPQMDFTNVDLSKPADVAKTFQYLLNTLNNHEQRMSSHDDMFAELSALRSENATLKSQIVQLQAQLNSTTGPVPSASTPSVVSPSRPMTSTPVPQKNTFAAVAARSATKPVTKKRKLAAARQFVPVDPSAPRGFCYLYLNRKRKLSRDEVRKSLRLIGLDMSRVLDICFPGPKVLGLLVHAQYRDEVISHLATAKVPLVEQFDPLDPVNLADPALQYLSVDDKSNKCAELQFLRCTGALSNLRSDRSHLVGPIGKYFSSMGWIDDDSLSQILASIPRAPTSSRSRDPGAVFRGDTEMADVSVVVSSGAESPSL